MTVQTQANSLEVSHAAMQKKIAGLEKVVAFLKERTITLQGELDKAIESKVVLVKNTSSEIDELRMMLEIERQFRKDPAAFQPYSLAGRMAHGFASLREN